MKELTNKELNMIVGGSLSGAVISSILKGVDMMLELGRSLGSSIRRLFTKNFC